MTAVRLADEFEGVVCDLDGVVYAGPEAIQHAVGALNALEMPVVYATNNASRTPQNVGSHLRELGVQVEDKMVVTSSLAAARRLARDLDPGSRVLAIGGVGVSAALRAAGLEAMAPGDDGQPVAVLQGYGPDVTASDLGEAAHAIRGGARWVVTNEDLTLPTQRGPAPGNGSLVAAVRNAVEIDPEVIGKPHPPMYELAADVLGSRPERVLAVGDRLETDIEGAVATGMSGALVLTGVHGPADAAGAARRRRPVYILNDLRDLGLPYPDAVSNGPWFCRGTARARLDSALEIQGVGVDALRASLDAVWSAVDHGRITPQDAVAIVANR